MPKKYPKSKCVIRNTLYKRFVNVNRGNTPRGFNTRYLTFTFDKRRRRLYNTLPYTIRSSRIYTIHHKINGLFEDIRFDFCNHNSTSSIITLANTLSCDKVAGVYLNSVNGNIKSTYIYPFQQGKGYRGNLKLYNEESSKFYPGVYYSMGSWFYSDSLSDSLIKITPKYGDVFYNNTTDYTSINTELVNSNILYNTNRRYFIYIPFDIISTPILQAYLPISKTFTLRNDVFDENQDSVYNIEHEIRWMGKDFVLQHIKNVPSSREEFLKEYTRSGSSFTNTPTVLQGLCRDHLFNNLNDSSLINSFQIIENSPYTGAFIIQTPMIEWSSSKRIPSLNSPPTYVLVPAYVKKSEIDSRGKASSLSTDWNRFSCDKHLSSCRIVFTFYVEGKEANVNFQRVYRYGIQVDYTPRMTTVTYSNNTVFPNTKINSHLREIIAHNLVSCDSGFSHLNRSI